jgi:hypothetical protein
VNSSKRTQEPKNSRTQGCGQKAGILADKTKKNGLWNVDEEDII